MKVKKLKKLSQPKFRSHMYEASLTAKERDELHARLRSNQEMKTIVAEAPPWGGGTRRGKKVSRGTIFGIRNRIGLEDVLSGLEKASLSVEDTKSELHRFLKGSLAEETLDKCMELIGEEVINRTLQGLKPEARTAAARLLLKRADQRRVDRRLDMLEQSLEQDKPAQDGKAPLTPEQKEERVKQILGIS